MASTFLVTRIADSPQGFVSGKYDASRSKLPRLAVRVLEPGQALVLERVPEPGRVLVRHNQQQPNHRPVPPP